MTHQWYMIYFSFTVTISIVLMFGAQMKMLAKEFNIPDSYFGALLVLFPLGNGLSRVFAGAVSDRIGRERTMVIFYSLLGLSILSFALFVGFFAAALANNRSSYLPVVGLLMLVQALVAFWLDRTGNPGARAVFARPIAILRLSAWRSRALNSGLSFSIAARSFP